MSRETLSAFLPVCSCLMMWLAIRATKTTRSHRTRRGSSFEDQRWSCKFFCALNRRMWHHLLSSAAFRKSHGNDRATVLSITVNRNASQEDEKREVEPSLCSTRRHYMHFNVLWMTTGRLEDERMQKMWATKSTCTVRWYYSTVQNFVDETKRGQIIYKKRGHFRLQKMGFCHSQL